MADVNLLATRDGFRVQNTGVVFVEKMPPRRVLWSEGDQDAARR